MRSENRRGTLRRSSGNCGSQPEVVGLGIGLLIHATHYTAYLTCRTTKCKTNTLTNYQASDPHDSLHTTRLSFNSTSMEGGRNAAMDTSYPSPTLFAAILIFPITCSRSCKPSCASDPILGTDMHAISHTNLVNYVQTSDPSCQTSIWSSTER